MFKKIRPSLVGLCHFLIPPVLMGRSSAFQNTYDGEKRETDTSQSCQHACRNEIVSVNGTYLE